MNTNRYPSVCSWLGDVQCNGDLCAYLRSFLVSSAEEDGAISSNLLSTVLSPSPLSILTSVTAAL